MPGANLTDHETLLMRVESLEKNLALTESKLALAVEEIDRKNSPSQG